MQAETVRLLDRRALNRALLARQWLLRRRRRSPEEALEQLAGAQAQLPGAPYVGLWSRLADFRPERLGQALEERRVVRLTLMRATVHIVTARDALALRPLVQPALDRLVAVDDPELAAAGRALLEEAPRTTAELCAALAERWPNREGDALAMAVRLQVPTVQVTPRGVWGKSGQARWATVEGWLGRPLAAASPDELVLRYLAAFGPATVSDVQTWSGLTKLRAVVERLRPGLTVLTDERGRELFDVPGAPRPHPDTPAPPRFLPEYDNLTLSHDDRTRVIADHHRRRLMTGNGAPPGTFLVDGFVRGCWRVHRAGEVAVLEIEPFLPLRGRDRVEVVEEGERLLGLLAADAGERAVEIR